MQQCDSNPRPLATSALSVERHVYRSATLKSLGNICINSQNGRFLKLGGPTESACMSDKLKWVRFRQAASSIDQHRGKEVANLKIVKESGSGLRKGRETVAETMS